MPRDKNAQCATIATDVEQKENMTRSQDFEISWQDSLSGDGILKTRPDPEGVDPTSHSLRPF